VALKKIPNRGAVRFLLLLTAPEEKLVETAALHPFPTVLNPVPPCGAMTDARIATKLVRPSWAVCDLVLRVTVPAERCAIRFWICQSRLPTWLPRCTGTRSRIRKRLQCTEGWQTLVRQMRIWVQLQGRQIRNWVPRMWV
jgi:hypothetical protein